VIPKGKPQHLSPLSQPEQIRVRVRCTSKCRVLYRRPDTVGTQARCPCSKGEASASLPFDPTRADQGQSAVHKQVQSLVQTPRHTGYTGSLPLFQRGSLSISPL